MENETRNTFGQLSTQNSEFVGVPEEFHDILQLILRLLHSLDVLKRHILHLDGVDRRVQAGGGAESHYDNTNLLSVL